MVFILKNEDLHDENLKLHKDAQKTTILGNSYWTIKFDTLEDFIVFASQNEEIIIGKEKVGTIDGFTDHYYPTITIHNIMARIFIKKEQ